MKIVCLHSNCVQCELIRLNIHQNNKEKKLSMHMISMTKENHTLYYKCCNIFHYIRLKTQ